MYIVKIVKIVKSNLEQISIRKFFKDYKLHSSYVLVHFLSSLKINLLVLICSKLHFTITAQILACSLANFYRQ